MNRLAVNAGGGLEARKGTEMGTDFKREQRYIVFKIMDALVYLSACELELLQEIGEVIVAGRAAAGKLPLNVVVVEEDWPEFEPTWAVIEARMTASPHMHTLRKGLV